MKKPGNTESKGAAGRINAHVENARRACWDENLMKFVARREKKHDEQRAADARPGPRRQRIARKMERSKDQKPKNGIFEHMAAFPREMMNAFHFPQGHMRKKPVQERNDDAR
jgi:hypothetical protein